MLSFTIGVTASGFTDRSRMGHVRQCSWGISERNEIFSAFPMVWTVLASRKSRRMNLPFTNCAIYQQMNTVINGVYVEECPPWPWRHTYPVLNRLVPHGLKWLLLRSWQVVFWKGVLTTWWKTPGGKVSLYYCVVIGNSFMNHWTKCYVREGGI